MIVEKIMNKNVITVNAHSSLFEAIQIMADNHIGCVVVTRRKELAGIMTERDVLVAIASEAVEDIKKAKVESVMTNYLITIKSKKPISKAIELMSENKIKKLPVLNDKGKLVGIITSSDIIAAQPRYIKNIKKLISFKV